MLANDSIKSPEILKFRIIELIIFNTYITYRFKIRKLSIKLKNRKLQKHDSIIVTNCNSLLYTK